MDEECSCGQDCEICEECGYPYCECECDKDEKNEKDDEDDEMDW
ncbi:hypothetical protein ACFL6I_24470 [candidate division KSB1 bacterium]